MTVFGMSWVKVNDDGDLIELDTHIDHFSGVDPILFRNSNDEKNFNENMVLLLTKLKELYFGGK